MREDKKNPKSYFSPFLLFISPPWLHPIGPGKIRSPVTFYLSPLVPDDIPHDHGLPKDPLRIRPIPSLQQRDVAQRIDPPPERLLAQPVCPPHAVLSDRHREFGEPVRDRIAEHLDRVRLDLFGKDLLPGQIAEPFVVVPIC